MENLLYDLISLSFAVIAFVATMRAGRGLTVNPHGGLLFFRCRHFGGSFYIAKKAR